MTRVTAPRALVLNADFRPLSAYPLSLVSAEDAVRIVFLDRASVLEEWDTAFHSPSTTIRLPKVIALRQYAPISQEVKFCRRGIFLRDRFSCQYCGNKFDGDDLTFDHVIPRSKGGKTCWENILTACMACNLMKRNHMPNFSGKRGNRNAEGMRPLKVPRQPTTAEMLRAGLECLENDLRATYGEWLYWNVELQP